MLKRVVWQPAFQTTASAIQSNAFEKFHGTVSALFALEAKTNQHFVSASSPSRTCLSAATVLFCQKTAADSLERQTPKLPLPTIEIVSLYL